jgi:hypothetical protein
MTKIILTKKDIQRHAFIWIIITVILQYADPFPPPMPSLIAGLMVLMLDYMFIYYALFLFILPRFWKSNIYLLVTFCTLLYISYVIIIHINFHWLIPN